MKTTHLHLVPILIDVVDVFGDAQRIIVIVQIDIR